ncbi:MAG: hypothetical protein AAF228_02060 [Pseudomonadota bacterium]
MSETQVSAAQQHDRSKQNGATSDPEVYRISLSRQIIFWIMFVMFLPFFISMPVMIMMRATHGQTTDAIALAAIFVFAMLAMGFIILQISMMGRLRFELDNESLKFCIPSWRGPTPSGPVIEKHIPYDDISSIEQRAELYRLGGLLGPSQVSSITTRQGERYVLGYMTENDTDAPIPIQKISSSLSQKSGKPIEHKGCVDAGTQLGAFFRGAPSWEAVPLSKQDVAKIRDRSALFGKAFIFGFFILLISVIILSLFPKILTLLS